MTFLAHNIFQMSQNNQSQKTARSNKALVPLDKRVEDFTSQVKIKAAGDSYMIAFLKKLQKISTNMIGTEVNKNFSFGFPKFQPSYTDQICSAILTELQIDHQSEEVKESPIKKLKKEEVNKILEFIYGQINSFSNKNVDGDFDIIVQKQMAYSDSIQILKGLEKIIEESSSQFQKKNFWVIKDYLGLENQNKMNDSNQTAINIFELKRSPFIQQSNIKIKNQAVLQEIQKIKKKPYEQLLTYREQFLFNTIKDNMLHNVCQIIKLIYATINEFYKEQYKGYSFDQIFRTLRNKNEFEFKLTMKKTSHPKIILYYIINNKITSQQVAKYFNFFKPLLKNIFKSEKAILHIIGFSQVNQMEQFKQDQIQKDKEIEELKKKSQDIIKQNEEIKKKNEKICQQSEENKKRTEKISQQNEEIRKKNEKICQQSEENKKRTEKISQQNEEIRKNYKENEKKTEKICQQFDDLKKMIMKITSETEEKNLKQMIMNLFSEKVEQKKETQ